MPEFELIPCISIHPDRLNVYHKILWHPYKPTRSRAEHLLGVSKDHAGKVSIVARRKINKAIKYLLFLANDKTLPDTAHGKAYSFKLAFITLTLPSTQVHPDVELKDKLLNQFLVEIRQKYGVSNYLWRAEKQKNGNLHFHVLCDKFIPWSELRDRWNRICNKLGYVDRYRDEMRAYHAGGFKVRKQLLKTWEYKAQIKAYNTGKANDWNSPNSTDIHSVHKIRDIAAYLSKYCTKDEQTKGLSGRLWGCNYQLSDIPGGQLVVDSHVSDSLNRLIEKYNPDLYSGKYFSTFFINLEMLRDPEADILLKAFSAFLINHFSFNLQSKFYT